MLTFAEAEDFCAQGDRADAAAKLIEADQSIRLPTRSRMGIRRRAGTTTKYSFGDDAAELDDYAWHTATQPATIRRSARRSRIRWGLYDMHGYSVGMDRRERSWKASSPARRQLERDAEKLTSRYRRVEKASLPRRRRWTCGACCADSMARGVMSRPIVSRLFAAQQAQASRTSSSSCRAEGEFTEGPALDPRWLDLVLRHRQSRSIATIPRPARPQLFRKPSGRSQRSEVRSAGRPHRLRRGEHRRRPADFDHGGIRGGKDGKVKTLADGFTESGSTAPTIWRSSQRQRLFHRSALRRR